MPNPRLASRYAKSLIDLSIERNQLEVVYNDMQFLKQVCKSSPDFVNLLRSPIIRADKKQAIIDAITKDKTSALTDAFMKLLIAKGREDDMPEIVTAFITQYNAIKGIHKVRLTTASAISDDLKNAIVSKVKKEANLENVELDVRIDEKLIGGFVLEFNNNLVDASVLRDLKDISKQFKERNVFVRNIR
ncbi:MAG: ATP synthase F1 subunit delta [Parafilimonas sp.]